MMRQSVSAVLVSGARYLQLATALLQRMRLLSPAGGIWEAADVQWWSRQERPSDRHGQLFWLDGQGCARLKVSNDISLYLRAGFVPLLTATLVTYARPAMEGGS
jgi:hypothetical protein